MFEQCFEQAYLENLVYFKGRHVTLRWSDELTNRFNYEYNLQDQQEPHPYHWSNDRHARVMLWMWVTITASGRDPTAWS